MTKLCIHSGKGSYPTVGVWHLAATTPSCAHTSASVKRSETGCLSLTFSVKTNAIALMVAPVLNVCIKNMHTYQISSNAFLSFPELKKKNQQKKLCFYDI